MTWWFQECRYPLSCCRILGTRMNVMNCLLHLGNCRRSHLLFRRPTRCVPTVFHVHSIRDCYHSRFIDDVQLAQTRDGSPRDVMVSQRSVLSTEFTSSLQRVSGRVQWWMSKSPIVGFTSHTWDINRNRSSSRRPLLFPHQTAFCQVCHVATSHLTLATFGRIQRPLARRNVMHLFVPIVEALWLSVTAT